MPEHLRGKPVPDMTGSFARGIVEGELVGVVSEAGALGFPGVSVSGGDFVMESAGRGGVLNHEGRLQVFRFEPAMPGGTWWALSYPRGGKVEAIGAGPDDKYHNFMGWGKNRPIPALPTRLASRNTNLFTGRLLGSVVVDGREFPLDRAENQPKHVTGRWIMRIE